MISLSFLRGTESFLPTYFLKKKELACLTQLLLPLPPKLSQYHHPIYIAFGTVIRFSASFRAVLPVGEHGPPRGNRRGCCRSAGVAKEWSPGCGNFTGKAWKNWKARVGTKFTQPGNHSFGDPCREGRPITSHGKQASCGGEFCAVCIRFAATLPLSLSGNNALRHSSQRVNISEMKLCS